MADKKKTDTIKSLKKEMDDFKADVNNKFDTVKSLLEEIVNKDKRPNEVREETPIIEEGGPVAPLKKAEEVSLSEEQNKIFIKYFDPEDGFTATIDGEGIFKIIVPLSLSNATQAHKDFYKFDYRTKKVDQNNVLGSIEAYCKLVAQNLQYNRQIRIKL